MRYIQSHTGSSLEKVLAGLELAGPPERGPADNNFSKNGIFCTYSIAPREKQKVIF